MGAAGKRLLEMATGGVVGGTGAYLTRDKNEGADVSRVAAGFFGGAAASAGGSKFLRNRRAQKLMRDLPSDMATPEIRTYYKDLTSPQKLSRFKTRRLVSSVPSHPKWGGASGADLIAYADDVELTARRFGRAKAFQGAYGDVKQQLMDTGLTEPQAGRAAAKAIFDRKGTPVAKDMANTALQGSAFRRRQSEHAKRFIDGKVDPKEVNVHIQQFTNNRIPGIEPVSPNHNHLANPDSYKDISKVLESMRDPMYRKQHQSELGEHVIKDLVGEQTFWGFGRVKA